MGILPPAAVDLLGHGREGPCGPGQPPMLMEGHALEESDENFIDIVIENGEAAAVAAASDGTAAAGLVTARGVAECSASVDRMAVGVAAQPGGRGRIRGVWRTGDGKRTSRSQRTEGDSAWHEI